MHSNAQQLGNRAGEVCQGTSDEAKDAVLKKRDIFNPYTMNHRGYNTYKKIQYTTDIYVVYVVI